MKGLVCESNTYYIFQTSYNIGTQFLARRIIQMEVYSDNLSSKCDVINLAINSIGFFMPQLDKHVQQGMYKLFSMKRMPRSSGPTFRCDSIGRSDAFLMMEFLTAEHYVRSTLDGISQYDNSILVSAAHWLTEISCSLANLCQLLIGQLRLFGDVSCSLDN